MKHALLSLAIGVLLLVYPLGTLAQEIPPPVPEATPEVASFGQSVPSFQTGGQPQTMAEFVGLVMQDVSAMWANLFESWGYAYTPPSYVTVEAGTYAMSNCGVAAGNPAENAALNPAFYCISGGEFGTQVIQSPVIYLSMPWFSEYFSAAVADTDFAIAYVVAHEVAHHIEYLLGYIDSTGRGCCGYIDEQIELWADCLAGVWGYSAYYEGQLEGTDVEEAQAAAWSVGSDLPHELGSPGDHGTRHERLLAFMTGYNSGDANLCFQSDLGGWYG